MSRPLLAFASQEMVLAARSRWTQIFAVVFGTIACAVAASGYILSGGHGVQDFARTSVSLVQLVILVVPLTSLLIGVMSLAPETGAAEMVFSQPVARRTVLFGRLLGQFLALAAAQGLGFGAAGAVISWEAGDAGVGRFVLLAAGSLALTAVFLGVAALVAVGSPGRRARALAIALAVWFGAVVVFDVAALTAASFLRSGSASRLLIVSVLVNPVDAVRTGTLLGIEGATAFGAASLAFLRFTQGAAGAALAICGSVVFWLVVPLWIAARRLERADI